MFLLFLLTPFTAVLIAEGLYRLLDVRGLALLVTTFVLQTAINVWIARLSGARPGRDLGVGLLVSVALLVVFGVWAVSAGPSL